MSGGFRTPGTGVGGSGVRRASTERYRDEEEGDHPEPVGTVQNLGAGSGYYGYETNRESCYWVEFTLRLRRRY